MKRPKMGTKICVILIGMSFISGSPIFGQSEPSSRRPSDSKEIEFPGVKDNRSLLSKMMNDRIGQANQIEEPPRSITGQKTVRSKPERNAELVSGQRSMQKTIAQRDTEETQRSQYPIYQTRKVQNNQLPVRSQRSVRVASPITKPQTDRNARQTSNRERRNKQVRIAKNSQSVNQKQNRKYRTDVVPRESAPLVSVLESKDLVATSPQTSVRKRIAKTQSRPNEVSNVNVAVENRQLDKNNTERIQNRRPSQILLEAERSSDVTRFREVENRIRKKPANLFDSREPVYRDRVETGNRVAKHEAVFENLSDSPDITFEESVPFGQGRLVFNKTLKQPKNANPLRIADQTAEGKVNANFRSDLGSPATQHSPDDVIESIEAMESESFKPSDQKSDIRPPTRPSKLLLNNRSRYNLSPSKTRNSISLPKRELKPLDGIQMSFGDQETERKESVVEKPELSLEPINNNTSKNDSQLSDDIVKKKIGSDDDEVLSNEQRNENYVSHLHRSLPLFPAKLALSYVDDKGEEVPANSLKTQYLVGFAGYYSNTLNDNLPRTDSFGGIWPTHCAVWVSPNICYKPLYFENVNLERYGARHPFFQPALSAVHFFGSTIRLPYMTALDPINECRYTAGFGRPGNKYCYQAERMPWSLKAGSFQALLVTAAVFALP